MQVDEADCSRCLFEHPREHAFCKCLVRKVGEDTVGECRIVGQRCIKGVCLAARELPCPGEHAACRLDESGRVVRAADSNAVTLQEIEVRSRPAADVEDAHPCCEVQQILDALSLHEERIEWYAAIHDVEAVHTLELEEDILPAAREGSFVCASSIPNGFPFAVHVTFLPYR